MSPVHRHAYLVHQERSLNFGNAVDNDRRDSCCNDRKRGKDIGIQTSLDQRIAFGHNGVCDQGARMD
jgi:hypothetical protein